MKTVHALLSAAALTAATPDAVFCTSDAMAMGVLDARRADFPDNRPERFRLYGFDNLSMTHFDAYPIASIGYDKAAYVEAMVRLIETAEGSDGRPEAVSIPTAFFPRATA